MQDMTIQPCSILYVHLSNDEVSGALHKGNDGLCQMSSECHWGKNETKMKISYHRKKLFWEIWLNPQFILSKEQGLSLLAWNGQTFSTMLIDRALCGRSLNDFFLHF